MNSSPCLVLTGQAAERRSSDHHRNSVLAVYVTSLVQGALGVTFPASSAVLRDRLLLSDNLYGGLFLPGLGLALATSLLGPALLRRWSLKGLFLFALVLQSVTMALMGLSGSLPRGTGLPVLVLAMVISGPAGGIIGITLNTAAIELFPRARSGALSVLHGFLGGGAALGPLLVASFIHARFWAGAPLFLSVILLVLLAFTRGKPVVGMKDTLDVHEQPAGLPRRLWVRSMTAFVYGVAEATFTAWAVVYLKEDRDLPVGIAASALSAFWIAMTAGRLAGAAAVRWVSPTRLAFFLAFALSGSFLLVARCGGAVDSLARFAFAGLACSALFPLLLAITSAEFPNRTPQVSAVFSAMAMAGLAVGCFAVGPLRGWIGLERVYSLSALGPVSLVLLLIGLKRYPAMKDLPARGNPKV